MPLQGSGSISISEIVTEFGGTAPHSLSEYYKGGSNVPSTKAISASGTKSTDGATTNFGSVTGLTVTRSDDTSSTASSTVTLSGSSIVVSANTYVDFSVSFTASATSTLSSQGGGLCVYSGGNSSSGATITGANGFTLDQVIAAGSKSGGGSQRTTLTIDGGSNVFSGSQSGTATHNTDYSIDASFRVIGGANLSQLSFGDGGETCSSTGTSSSITTTMRINGYTSSGTTINFTSVAGSGPTLVNGNHNTTKDVGVYDFSVTNGTGVDGTANSTSVANNATVTISDNQSSSSLAVSWASTEALNADVPTSGSISMTDFYSAEDA